MPPSPPRLSLPSPLPFLLRCIIPTRSPTLPALSFPPLVSQYLIPTLTKPTVRPKTVNIQLPESPLVAGERARLECVTLGAHPDATITWTKTSTRGTTTTPLRALVSAAPQLTSELIIGTRKLVC